MHYPITGFRLSFDAEIQGLSRILKLHFQGTNLGGCLQHAQYNSKDLNVYFCDDDTVIT